VLIRAGIENFVLVDPQRLSPSNLERLHGSYDSDLDTEPYPFKVELAQRMIWAINPNAKVTALVGNVLQENVIDELLTCDLVLCCTDSIHSRVFLSDYAKHFLLPSIDVGIDMDGQSGQITSQLVQLTKYTPDLPCAFCNGLIDTAQMSVELMTEDEKRARQAAAKEAEKRGDNPDQYWRNQRQLHTVGYLTTTAGALTAGYAEGWLTGAFEMPHSAFQFDIGQERLGVVPCLPVRTSCNCGEHIGWADQAKAFRNVSRPPHIPSKALLLSRNVQLC
jgi:tRNA A37 threonylcarbamoyladenosine dehydratase